MAVNWTTLTGAKTVTGSIANWCNRPDLATTNILIEAQAWLYQYLRVREMMTDEAFTFASAASSKALSTLASTFLDPIQFIPYEWGSELAYISPEMFKPSRSSAGALESSATPNAWTIIGSTAHLDVLLSAAFSGRMMYYFQPADLSVSNETNFLTTRYPKLLRETCMAFGYQHMKDTARGQEYLGYAMVSIQEANKTNEMWRRGQH
jgi:hypothetical protein